ncbi:hypothetical protein INT43_005629 [Umbelopsis isabellina]|uniref:Uncharacterized protein n=1 Tax=Mortierella isabellina TaxID=91625 RepID=A0A8H7PMD2_MORIS|nr:hypothetical protein INT43_005629 [Umbelopsis isabellina]
MSTFKKLPLLLLWLTAPLLITAVTFGQACDPTTSHLNAYLTYVDACDDPSGMYACASNNTCAFKTCVNTNYLKNWSNTTHKFPSRCTGTKFCPDNGLQCLPMVAQGGACELDRDDECAGGAYSICLNRVCSIKGVPVEGNCVIESTQFAYMDQNGEEAEGTYERDNCTVGAYCENTKCIAGLPNGAPCTQDRVCFSNSCYNDGVGGAGFCGNPPDSFKEVPISTWAAIGVSVLVFMLLILLALWFLHRYQSKKEHAKIQRFFDMQDALRQYSGNDTPEMSEGAILLGTPRLYAHSNKSDSSIVSDIRNRMSMPGSRPSSQLLS